ncbi:MAG: MG2 domain-containing protein [Planctomycetota bacterium]
MLQQGSGRYWLVVGLFLTLNAGGLVWIRHAWDPRGSRLVTLDVTPQVPTKTAANSAADSKAAETAKESVAPTVKDAPKVVPVEPPKPARMAHIVDWLPVSNEASALVPENVVPGFERTSSASFDTAERLLAVFDRSMVREAELNRPLERSPFHIQPKVAGHWRWTSTDRLAFVLDNPLPPGRKFEITAAVDFNSQFPAELDAASRTFQFKTRSLEWTGLTLQSSDREWATMELQFNQPVIPADLMRAMLVTDARFPVGSGRSNSRSDQINPFESYDEKAIPFESEVLTKEASTKLVVRTKLISFAKSSGSLKVVLDANLTGAGADLPLGLVTVREVALPKSFTFVRSQVEIGSFNSDATVQLYFSSGLSADQERPKVKVAPAVDDFRVEFTPNKDGADRYAYGPGIVVRGKFLCGQQYSLTLPPTLLAHNGQTLGNISPETIRIPHRPADLEIAAGQGILIPDGNLTLDLKCVNIDGVRLSASRLHANNLAGFLQGRNDTATMRSIVQERVRSLDLTKDEPQTIGLDLRQLLGTNNDQASGQATIEPRTGLYRLSVADTNQYWNRDTATVAISDLGITAKRGRNRWLVWVLSLRTATPLSGVTVTARSYNNQVLAQATSDATGIATLSIPDNHPDGQAWLLTAERDGDLNYLLPDQHSWMNDSVDQSGRPWPNNYEAMLYAERGVYRPGDMVHLTGILRDRLGHRPPPFPLTVKVTRPDGRAIAELPCQPAPESQGTFQVEFPSSATGQTGIYRFDVAIPGSREILGTTTAQIETFVPVRIAVKADSAKPRFIRENPVVHTSARYLFGQPAAGLNAMATGTWSRKSFTSRKYQGFQFGDFSGRNQLSINEVNETLDQAGESPLTIDQPQDPRPGLWSAQVTATVTEIGGRSVSTATTVEADTAGIHLGVKLPENRVVVVGEPTKMEWVVLDALNELAASRPLELSLFRVDYDTAIEEINGRSVWKTIERLIEIESPKITGDTSEGMVELTCPNPGRYRLRLVDPESRSATQVEFYAATNRSDRIDVPLQQPEQIDLVLDRAKYHPGDIARVLVRSPFAGRLLLTLEGDRVYDPQTILLEANSQLIEVPIPAELRGGAYVTATVIRAIDPKRADWLPHRAYGLARLVIDRDSRSLPIKLESVTAVLPGSLLKVRAQVDWAAEPGKPEPAAGQIQSGSAAAPVVHLWAVDEGILLTTRYATPKPLDFFHAPRKLGVSSSDIYSSLLPDHLRPANMTRIGADKGDDEDGEVDANRRGPVDTPRKAPTVVWRAIQTVSDDGSLVVDMPIPQFTGGLRLMAVAVHGDRYGSIDQRVTVTSPLLVETTWPRCAAPNDQFRVPVKVFNTTNDPLDIHLTTVVDGPVSVKMAKADGMEPVTVKIPANSSAIQWLNVTGLGLGTATVRVDAMATAPDATSLTAFSESSLPIRSATALDSETIVERHQVGEPVTLKPAAGFQEGSTRVSLAISGLPSMDLSPAVDSLIDYPYGCGEQTSSRIYALVAALSWMESDPNSDVDASRKKFVSQLIDAGIVRLWSMQNRNGGIGYWNGGPTEPWISAYAAGAVVAARDAGRTIDPQFLGELGKYLESALDGQGGIEIDDNSRAFICRILASIDKPKHGWMSRLSDRIEFLDAEGRSHLAAAWIRLGRKDRALSVLPPETFRLTAVTNSAGRITSPIRQDASLLQVLLELDQQHAMIPGLVGRIQSTRKNQLWMNTLENASAVTALSRYRATAPPKNDFAGSVQWGAEKKPFSHKSTLLERRSGEAEPITITTEGSGEFYVVRTTEGLRTQREVVAYDHQLKVRRKWLDRAGKEVDPATLNVGDLVTVEIQISTNAGTSVPNVAIVDALPGGLEIENPRLATSATPDAPSVGRADHIEFLDDRAVLFTTVHRHMQFYRYAVRVTTPGRFEWPPIQASSMYDPSVASIHGGGKVVVLARDEAIDNVAERPEDNASNRN